MPSKLKSKLKLQQLNIESFGNSAPEPKRQPTSCRESSGHGKSLATAVRHDSAVDVLALAAVNQEGDQSVPDCVIYGDEFFQRAATAGSARRYAVTSATLGTVYIGSVKAFWNTAWLKSNHVTHVLNCAGNLHKAFGPRQDEALGRALDSGIQVMTLPWRDHCFTDIQPILPTALRFVAQARRSGGACLVHCAAGRSRSATVVVAYDMLMRGCSVSDSVSRMVKRHKTTQPNPGFLEQLHEMSGWRLDVPLAAASADSGWQGGFGAGGSAVEDSAAAQAQATEGGSDTSTASSSDSDNDDVVPVAVDSVFGMDPDLPAPSPSEAAAQDRWAALASTVADIEGGEKSTPLWLSPVPSGVLVQTPRSPRQRFEDAGSSSQSGGGQAAQAGAVL